MNNLHFFKHFDRNRSVFQNMAFQLTQDFKTARMLYIEAAHQAIKNRNSLEPNRIEEWILKTMKSTYSQLSHNN